jgi:hypothetical protein
MQGKAMAVAVMLLSRCIGIRIVDRRAQLNLLRLLQQLEVVTELGLQEVVVIARLLREGRPCTSWSDREVPMH